MRLLLIALATSFIASCCCSPKATDAAAGATTDARNPASEAACNPNHFSPAFVAELNKEISAKYGLDFGMRCTEITELPLANGRTPKHTSKGTKGKMKPENGVFKDTRKKFTYDTEGCADYRAKACEAATKAWIAKAGGYKSDEAESGK